LNASIQPSPSCIAILELTSRNSTRSAAAIHVRAEPDPLQFDAQAVYEPLPAHGKLEGVALVAVMRGIIVILKAILKTNTIAEPCAAVGKN